MGGTVHCRRRIVSFVSIPCPLWSVTACGRIENTELLYPHFKIGHDATMKSVIASMEGQRVTVQQHILSTPVDPVILEDETVEDEPDDVLEPDEPPPVIDAGSTVIVVPDNLPDASTEPPEPSQPPVNDIDQILMPPPPPRPPSIKSSPIPVEEDGATVPLSCPPPTVVPTTEAAAAPVPPPSSAPPAAASVPAAATEPPPPMDDTVEREALLRQLDLLRLKFKQSIIPPDIETKATPAVRLIVERNLTNLKRHRNTAMYKLGLAAFLVIIEFVLARLLRLDMSRFLAWHCANLTAYEELLAEFSTVDTPFSTSPPYVQLMVLVTFNTAIFVGSALIQKAFQVDILPIVCSMTGANPLEAPTTRGAGAATAAAPPPSPFPAFTRNFGSTT